MVNGNGKPAGAALLSVILSVVIPLVSGAVGATVWGFAMRDQALQSVERAKVDEMAALRQELTHYLTIESFLQSRREEEMRAAARYYDLKAALDHLNDTVARRGR